MPTSWSDAPSNAENPVALPSPYTGMNPIGDDQFRGDLPSTGIRAGSTSKGPLPCGRKPLWRGRISDLGRRGRVPPRTIKARGECLSLLVVREFNRKDDSFPLLIVFELRRLASVLIEPFSHEPHRGGKLRGRQPYGDSSHPKVSQRLRWPYQAGRGSALAPYGLPDDPALISFPGPAWPEARYPSSRSTVKVRLIAVGYDWNAGPLCPRN